MQIARGRLRGPHRKEIKKQTAAKSESRIALIPAWRSRIRKVLRSKNAHRFFLGETGYTKKTARRKNSSEVYELFVGKVLRVLIPTVTESRCVESSGTTAASNFHGSQVGRKAGTGHRQHHWYWGLQLPEHW